MMRIHASITPIVFEPPKSLLIVTRLCCVTTERSKNDPPLQSQSATASSGCLEAETHGVGKRKKFVWNDPFRNVPVSNTVPTALVKSVKTVFVFHLYG